MKILKIVAISLILLVGLYVALRLGIVYASTPRIILYFLISFLPALLLGAEAASRFEFKFPGFVFTTAGACDVCFGAFVLLTKLSEPKEKIAVSHIVDELSNPATLDRGKESLNICR